MSEEPITCYDLKDVPGKPECCSSCHEDAEEFDMALCEGPEGKHLVCCAVNLWLKEKKHAGEGSRPIRS